MAYNVKAALDAGYTEAEIADEIAKEEKFNVAAAREGGYSDREILAELTKPEPGLVETGYRGFRRSLGELGVLATDTLPALAASALLPEETAKPFVKRQFKEAEEARADLESRFPTVYGSYKEVEDIGSGIGYVTEKFGELLPDILPSIATGGVGAFLGKKAATEAAEKAAKEVAQKTELELLEGGVESAIEATTYKNIADRVGRRAAESITNDYVKSGIGVGAFLGSYAQNAPEVFENIFEETGEIAPAGALLFGGLSSMLDAYLPAKLLGSFGNYGKSQIVSKMLQDSGANPSVWKAVLREGAKAAGTEGLTEAAQEGISVAAEKFYGSNKEFFSPENVDRYLESFFAGAAGGGVLGGLSGVKQGLQEKAVAEELRPPPPSPPVDQTVVAPPDQTPPGETPPGETPPDETPPGDVPTFPSVLGSEQLDLIGFKPDSNTYNNLLGLDMSKPEDIEEATKIVKKVMKYGDTYANDERKQKTLEVVNAAIVAAGGTPIDLTSVTKKDEKQVPPTGTKPPEDVSQTGQTDVNAALGTVDKKAELKKKLAEAKAGKKAAASGKLAIGDRDFDYEIAQLEAELKATEDDISLINVYEANRQFYGQKREKTEGKEKTQTEFDKEVEQDIEQDTVPYREQAGPVSLLEGDLYEQGVYPTGRPRLPAWEELSVDEKFVFEDALGDFGRAAQKAGEPVSVSINRALTELESYRKSKGDQRGDKNIAVAAYETNRQAESTYRGLILPRWNALPEPLKKAFLTKVKSPKERTAQYQGPDYETQQAGFDAVEEAINNNLEKYADLKEELKSGRVQENIEQRGEVERQRQVQAQEMDERLGLNQPLPDDIAEAAKRGELKAVLDYLEKSAKGQPPKSLVTNLNPAVSGKKARGYEKIGILVFDEKTKKSGVIDQITSGISRIVAKQINSLQLKTKLVYDETYNPRFGPPAEYDPSTDTIRIGPRGLNEVAILHEMTHAATVNVLYKFLNNRKNELTAQQREGAARLITIYASTQKQLSGQFPFAYANVYEFVAYAMTDPKFQAELQKRRVPTSMIKFTDIPEQENIDEPISNAWAAFVRSISQVLKLFRRIGKFFSIEGVPNNLFDQSRTKSKKETEEDLELTDEAIEKLDEEIKAKEKDPVYRSLKKKLAQVEKIESGYVQRKIKLVERLIQEEKKGLKKNEADKIFEYSPNIQKNLEYKKAVADIKRQENNVKQVLDEFEKAGFEDLMPGETVGDVKRGVITAEDPGYIGNMFLEIAGAFSTILDALPDGNIPSFNSSVPSFNYKKYNKLRGSGPLYVGATPIKSAQQEADEVLKRLQERLEGTAATNVSKIGEVLRGLFDRDKRNAYATNLIQKFQNSKIWFQKLEDNLDKTGRLVTIGSLDEINNLDTAMANATALSQNLYNFNIKIPRDEAAQLIKKIQDSKKLDEKEMLALLQTYVIGLHDRERRHQKFLREVPLNKTADDERKTIYKKLASSSLIKKLSNPQTKIQTEKEIDKLRADLEAIVADTKKRMLPNPAEPFNNENSEKYNALGYSYEVATEFLERFNKDKDKADIEALFNKLKKIQKVTEDLNRDANYFNPAIEAVIRFYGWKNYFPFKGKPDPTNKNQMYDLTSDRLGGDYMQGEMGFTGRQSDADNPILQVLTEATRAAMRAGHKEVPHTVKNLIKAGIISGSKTPKNIPFEERFDVDFNIKDIKKEDAFFIYKDDGSIDIYEVTDPDISRALKGIFKPDTPVIDAANAVTSFFGQMHTRYNPAFAPWDFTRNLATYAGLVGAKYGPKAGAQIINDMTRILSEGGMQLTLKFTSAFNKGKIDFSKSPSVALRAAGLQDTKFNQDIFEYYKAGGQTAYIQGLTSTQNLEGLAKQINSKGFLGINKENFDNFFDSWMAMFETTSRIAAYRTVRDRLIKENVPEAEAKTKAISFAKGMANFQQVGDLGKTIGALYMFWRPAATGAVRAMQALAPGFDFRTDEEIKQYFKNQTRFGDITDAQAEKAMREYNKERQNARLMSYSLLGVGFFVYMMAYMIAGDDEEERNKVAIDDMTRWVRAARFNTGIDVGGKDLVFQLPWGFGPGALASAGAQIASVATGNQNLIEAANNIMDAGFESFMPLPVSKIDKMDNPTAWAVDSLSPSALRPLVEFAMNTDGLGRSIYTDRQSRYADAFLGGDNVPDIWKDSARGLFSLTGGEVDVSPGSMYFFANNYFDGLTRAIATTYNLGNVIAGQKDFDPRTDTFLLDSYLKAPSNYDAIQFSKAEDLIKDMEQKLKALEGTPDYATYMSNNPTDQMAVDFYNETVNGELRDLRTEANRIRRDPNMSSKDRKNRIQLLTKQQNQIKSAFTTAMAGAYSGFEDLDYD